MRQVLLRSTCMILGLLAAGPSMVSAHPLDVAYLDLSADHGLTVAVHPYQAYELVRAGQGSRLDLARLRAAGELVAAYVEEHVDLRSASGPCTWQPGPAHVPQSELEAVADGVTIRAPVSCPNGEGVSNIGVSLFVDGFPDQKNIVRRETPEGFVDLAVLGRLQRDVAIDLSLGGWSQMTTSDDRPKDNLAALALRVLEGGMDGFAWAALFASAFIIGALHALGPGHGKALMAAAMLGGRPSVKKAVALGGVMTATHVSDVFLMSALAGGLAATLPSGHLFAFFQYLSALGLCILGIVSLIMALVRYRRALAGPLQASLDEAHARAHALGMPHTHGHDDDRRHFRKTLWAGFLGSLAPCPTAWAMFMATLSLGRWGLGLALLIAFSLGLATTIIAIGCAMAISASFMSRKTSPRFTYAMPVLSSALVTVLGVWLLYRAF